MFCGDGRRVCGVSVICWVRWIVQVKGSVVRTQFFEFQLETNEASRLSIGPEELRNWKVAWDPAIYMTLTLY